MNDSNKKNPVIGKKDKNTYVVKIPGSAFYYKSQRSTPFIIETINGEPVVGQTNGLMRLDFPNPAAYKMACSFKIFKPVMGEKLARTIVEYLDKDTRETVALLFPTNRVVHNPMDPDFISRMNHATRRDFKRQMAIRQKFIDKINENQH